MASHSDERGKEREGSAATDAGSRTVRGAHGKSGAPATMA